MIDFPDLFLFFSFFFCTLKYANMVRISNMSFFLFCWKNGKLDWPKCARTVFFSQFFWALRFLFRLNDSILINFLVFQGFFFRNLFIWKNTGSPCGCFVCQLVWWFPAMFCNAGPSHCFLAKKWSTDANSKEGIEPKLLH